MFNAKTALLGVGQFAEADRLTITTGMSDMVFARVQQDECIREWETGYGEH